MASRPLPPPRPKPARKPLPSLILHLVIYTMAGLVVKRTGELLRSERDAWIAVSVLAFGGLLSLVLQRKPGWLQAISGLAALAAVGAAFWLHMQHQPPVIVTLEVLVALLILAQGLGCRQLHQYSLMLFATFALLIGLVRHLGALPYDLLVPLVVLGVAAGCLVQGHAPANVSTQRATRHQIPWPALLARIGLLTAIALLGGRFLTAKVPPLRDDRGGDQMQMWVTYVRTNLGLDAQPITMEKMPQHDQEREGQMLVRNASPTRLDLTRSFPNSLSRRLLYMVDARRHVYLRTTVLDHYSGLAWAPSMKIELEPLNDGMQLPPQISLPERMASSSTGFDANAVCKIWPQTGVGYELAVPVTGRTLVRGNLQRVYRDPLNNLYSNEPVRRGMRYEVLLGTPDLSQLGGVRIGDDEITLAEQYLQLPEVSPELIRHCQEALDGELMRMAAVRKLITMIRDGKAYSRQPIILPADVDESTAHFLFEMDRGACGQFASALAVACRIVGIPARVALGYMPTYARTSSMMLQVREMDAHAWTQVWFPDVGWVDVDATPGGIDLEELPAPDVMHDEGVTLSESASQLTALWNATMTRLSSARQASVAWAMARKMWPLYALTMLIALSALWVVGRFSGHRLLWWWRWVRARRHEPRHAVQAEYQCLLEAVRRAGFEWGPTSTPDEIVDTLREKRYPWADAFAALTSTMQRHVFGPHPPDDEQRAAFRQQIVEVRRNLKPPAPAGEPSTAASG